MAERAYWQKSDMVDGQGRVLLCPVSRGEEEVTGASFSGIYHELGERPDFGFYEPLKETSGSGYVVLIRKWSAKGVYPRSGINGNDAERERLRKLVEEDAVSRGEIPIRKSSPYPIPEPSVS